MTLLARTGAEGVLLLLAFRLARYVGALLWLMYHYIWWGFELYQAHGVMQSCHWRMRPRCGEALHNIAVGPSYCGILWHCCSGIWARRT